jgi:inner membrane transporter RhtA
VLVLISVISIQLGAAVAVGLFDALGPVSTAFLRIAISALLLLAVRRFRVGTGARQHLGLLLLYGCVIGATNLFFYGAIARIPLGIAVAIEFIGPLGVAALTSRRPLDFVWVGLAAVGLLLITPEVGNDLDPVGVALALAAGVGWAGFVLLSPRVARDVGDGGLAAGMVVASLFTLPFALSAWDLQELEVGLLLGVLAVAVLSTALPVTLEFEALQRMTARAYGVMVTLEPVTAVVVGALLLSQGLPPSALAAVACISLAAVGVNLSDRRAAVTPPGPG